MNKKAGMDKYERERWHGKHVMHVSVPYTRVASLSGPQGHKGHVFM